MSATETTEQREFRTYCQQWLESNHPGRPPVNLPLSALNLDHPDQLTWLKEWQYNAWKAGLVGCDYPEAYGGGGRDQCQAIANTEMFRAKTPYLPNIVGMGMAGPAILHHATEEVKKELLPPLLSAEHIWCQGFSEPGAGWQDRNQRPVH